MSIRSFIIPNHDIDRNVLDLLNCREVAFDTTTNTRSERSEEEMSEEISRSTTGEKLPLDA